LAGRLYASSRSQPVPIFTAGYGFPPDGLVWGAWGELKIAYTEKDYYIGLGILFATAGLMEGSSALPRTEVRGYKMESWLRHYLRR
jgi:hypothetical protein